MKLSQGPAFASAVSLTSAPDIHLLFMMGLVFVAGIAGMGTVGLLLLLAPLAMLFMARTKPRQVATVSAGPAGEPDGGAAPPPSSLNGGDQASQLN
ncbi:hypothetical protein [Arthrobacter sp. ISL-95]|uniref:hypothetical protein n=1 Tax=Arthrobacter sp. ISL-95 TaxID=2819116 RepID=UPI001BEC6307|nr:hypothetical protein [Arthrobacter sp. ISL-95]MBT2585132.1 hypothetical protein [Arthrobacter sp. ISL-95]